VPASDVRIGLRVSARVLQREGATAIVVFDLVNGGAAT
jgi:hypothetical protein